MTSRNKTPLYVLLCLPRPEEYSARDALEYVLDAVQSWGGQRHPEDELFDLFRTARGRIVSPERALRLGGRTPNDPDRNKPDAYRDPEGTGAGGTGK